jgi:hypothetical protein
MPFLRILAPFPATNRKTSTIRSVRVRLGKMEDHPRPESGPTLVTPSNCNLPYPRITVPSAGKPPTSISFNSKRPRRYPLSVIIRQGCLQAFTKQPETRWHPPASSNSTTSALMAGVQSCPVKCQARKPTTGSMVRYGAVNLRVLISLINTLIKVACRCSISRASIRRRMGVTLSQIVTVC